MSIHYNMLVT